MTKCRHSTRPLMILHGKELVAAFMKKNMVGREDFFESKRPPFVEMRRQIILLLAETGLWPGEISRVMRCSRDRVRYWLDPVYRRERLATRLQQIEARA